VSSLLPVLSREEGPAPCLARAPRPSARRRQRPAFATLHGTRGTSALPRFALVASLSPAVALNDRWRVVGGKIRSVKKTSIYIESDVDVALARRAAAEGTTKAELIRKALRDAAGRSLRIKPQARGAFRGRADLASRADEHLAESGFGEQ
jgi:hypothetical protein